MLASGGEELVLVRYDLRTVDTHRVLVDMKCDHIPRAEPDPLEYGSATVTVVVADERPREVSRERVDVECTRNTY